MIDGTRNSFNQLAIVFFVWLRIRNAFCQWKFQAMWSVDADQSGYIFGAVVYSHITVPSKVHWPHSRRKHGNSLNFNWIKNVKKGGVPIFNFQRTSFSDLFLIKAKMSRLGHLHCFPTARISSKRTEARCWTFLTLWGESYNYVYAVG